MSLRIRRLLLALLSPCVALLLLELACRALGVAPARVEKPFKDFDLGWAFVSGSEPSYFVKSPTRFFEPRKNARGVARTDEHAFRGAEHPPHHARMLRVAVLGDSTTFGFGVRMSDSFVGRVEQALRSRHADLDVDVVNAGCPAYSTWQNRLDLDERVLPLAPDVVVLALSGFNDATGAVGFADEDWSRYAVARTGALATLLGRSRFAAFIERTLGPLWGRALVRDPQDAVRAVEEGRAPSGRRVPKDALAANERAMIDRIRAAGALPIVLVHCHPDAEIAKDPERREYSRQIEQVARESHVPCVVGSTALPTSGDGFYYDKIHPTETGHARLADLLGDAIEQALADSGRANGAAPAPGERPRLASVEPAAAPATGGVVARVRGGGFAGPSAPRFFVGDECAELVRVIDDGSADVLLPPLAPGAHDLAVATERGCATLAAAMVAVGPRLVIDVSANRAHLAVSGGAGEHALIHVASEPGAQSIQLGRVLGLKAGSMWPNPSEVDLDATGRAEIDVPFAKEAAGKTLWVQAFVGPKSGEYPRVLLPTNVVEAHIPGP